MLTLYEREMMKKEEASEATTRTSETLRPRNPENIGLNKFRRTEGVASDESSVAEAWG